MTVVSQQLIALSKNVTRVLRVVVCLSARPVLLCLVVVHVFVHGAVLRVESAFVVGDTVQLLLQAGDVGLQHGFDLRRGGCFLLQQLPLGLQHFVLLLQVSHLRRTVPGGLAVVRFLLTVFNG